MSLLQKAPASTRYFTFSTVPVTCLQFVTQALLLAMIQPFYTITTAALNMEQNLGLCLHEICGEENEG